MTDAGTGQFLGACGLGLRADGDAKIDYGVRTAETGRGVCTVAVRLAAGFAFRTLGVPRITIHIDPANAASRRVAEKAGARFDEEVSHTHDDGSVHRLVRYVLEPRERIERRSDRAPRA